MATHSSILAWRIPWNSGGLHSSSSHKESGTTETYTFSHFLVVKAGAIWEEMRFFPPSVVFTCLQGGITCGVLLIKSVDSCLPSAEILI